MDVINHYLQSLRPFLPSDQRDDIIRELSEEVLSQVAEKESALGRRLTDEEQGAIVGQYGHPLVLAARYRPQRSLIGPLVFPYYWTTLKVVLGIIVVSHLVGAIVMFANGERVDRLGSVFENAVETTLAALGWITVLAAWFDWWLARSRALDKWRPRAAVSGSPTGGLLARKQPTITDFIVSVIVSIWWLGGLRVPQWFFWPGAEIAWGPAMDRVYPVLVIAQVLVLLDQLLRLIGADEAWFSKVTRWVWLVSGWALIYLVATSDHQWMVWHGDAAIKGNARIVHLAGRDIPLVQFVNYIWSAIFIGIAIAGAWQSLRMLRRGLGGPTTAARVATIAVTLSSATHLPPAIAQPATPVAPLSDRDIRQILVERIDRQQQALGIVVGIVSPAGRRVVSHGAFDIDDPRPVDADTVFEIGSVTKVFTSWLLADMSRRGELNVNDEISRYLPKGLTARTTADGRTITLADLATHTAGLPFWPSNVPATGDTLAALAGYTVENLFQFISTFDVPADIGTRWAYSNIDAGLLGTLLARRAGSTYDTLLANRMSAPLGLTSTAVSISPSMRSRLAPGHTAQLKKAASWNVPALAGGGSLHSSVDDLLQVLAAFGDATSALGSALPTMLSTRRQAPGFQQALGWMVLASPAGGDELLFHDGQTLGFASSMAYEPKTRTGVVVLSNAAAGVGDIARHVLRPAIPLAKPAAPAPQRTEVQIDPKLFDVYAGQYAPGPGTVFVVSHEGESLMLQLPGLPKLRLRPEREREFFVAENTRISVTFEVDATVQVTRLLLRAPTGDVPAARVR
jgi:CubicO group peptidase (beta-lactamase class C family)